jgi:hypothetical protein
MKIETKITQHVDYNDLDDAINEFLKKKGCLKTFEFVSDHEMSNDSSKEFTIGKYDFSIPSEADKKEILNGRFSWKAGKILEWMHHEGEIPLGNYVVKVSW